jgi:glycopeptide antibiotics resistance protein
VADLLGWFFATTLSRAAGIAVLLLGIPLGSIMARLTAWRAWGCVLVVWGLGLALLVTFVSRIGFYDFSPDLQAINACVGGITRDWAQPEEFLNLMLLMPLGAGLAIASRSLPTSAASVVLVAVGIELGQSVTGLGTCERGDMVRNTAGGVAAAAVTWWLGSRSPAGSSAGAPSR